MMCLRSVLILLFTVTLANGANVLLLPTAAHSHCLEMVGIANELTTRGHSVYAYVPTTVRRHCFDGSNVTIINFELSEEAMEHHEEMLASLVDSVFKGANIFDLITKIKKSCNFHCESALVSVEKLKKLQKIKLDLAIVDAMISCNCLYYIPRFLKIPYVSTCSFVIEQDSGGPFTVNTNPLILTSYTADMTFQQRFFNLLFYLLFSVGSKLFNSFEPIDISKLQHIPEDVFEIGGTDLIRQSLLFLENSDPVLEYPKATYPNFIQVGGLTTRPAKPLPQHLENFMSQSKNGVIVVSFGSFMKNAPDYIFKKLLRAFQSLDRPVIMAYKKDGDHGNVKTLQWLPQNDLLGHANTVLFVSHCGKNGFFEGLYHGVPIICAPVHGDTFSTAVKVGYHKAGNTIDIIRCEAEEMVTIINDTLNDQNITRNMKKASSIFHAVPFTPQQRAANSIEMVLKYGGDHLKPSSSKMSFLAHTMLDIWFALFIFLIITSYIIYKIVRTCINCIFIRKHDRSKPKKKKTN